MELISKGQGAAWLLGLVYKEHESSPQEENSSVFLKSASVHCVWLNLESSEKDFLTLRLNQAHVCVQCIAML